MKFATITFAATLSGVSAYTATPGRCGPLFHSNKCDGANFCNEANGFCGATEAHRDAQESSAYDANDAEVRVALTGPRVPTPGRCGPLFYSNTCLNEGYYCNEANGYCGQSDAHRDAQSSTAYDGPSAAEAKVDLDDAAKEQRDKDWLLPSPIAPTPVSPATEVIFHKDMFTAQCNPKECENWTCVDWCHCFESNPLVEQMFNSLAYGSTLAGICPSDATPCEC